MYDFVFNVQPQAQNLLFGPPLDAFLPPLVGSFLGVITAFALNYALQKHKTGEDRKKYKKMIKSEIGQGIEILEANVIQVISVDQWSSIVNSGGLKLFEPEKELLQLNTVYQLIKHFNLLITNPPRVVELINWENLLFKDELKNIKDYRRLLLDHLRKLNDVDWLRT